MIARRLLIAFLLWSSIAHGATPPSAQWHLFLIPVTGTGSDTDPRRASFVDVLVGKAKVKNASFYYGQEPVAIFAGELTPGQDTALQANTDVVRVPDNLDATVATGADLNAIQTYLENVNIPADQITVATSYRTMMRRIFGMSSLLRRYAGISSDVSAFLETLGLDTPFSKLSKVNQAAFIQAGKELGLNTNAFIGTNTFRQILNDVGNQTANREFKLGGVIV